MIAPRAFRLLTFDLDDTLWPVRPVIIRAEHRLRNHLDAVAPRVYAELSSDEFTAIREARLAAEPSLRHRLSDLRRLVLEDALRAVGYGDAPALAAGAFEVFLDARHDVAYFEGTLVALQALATARAVDDAQQVVAPKSENGLGVAVFSTTGSFDEATPATPAAPRRNLSQFLSARQSAPAASLRACATLAEYERFHGCVALAPV